jgi:hypothetical protein
VPSKARAILNVSSLGMSEYGTKLPIWDVPATVATRGNPDIIRADDRCAWCRQGGPRGGVMRSVSDMAGLAVGSTWS